MKTTRKLVTVILQTSVETFEGDTEDIILGRAESQLLAKINNGKS